MGSPWDPKYIPYTYMDPLGNKVRREEKLSPEQCVSRLMFLVVSVTVRESDST